MAQQEVQIQVWSENLKDTYFISYKAFKKYLKFSWSWSWSLDHRSCPREIEIIFFTAIGYECKMALSISVLISALARIPEFDVGGDTHCIL